MNRLPLSQLNEALANPAAFRRKLDAGVPSGFGETYFGVLRQAIFQYHRGKSPDQTRRYLEQRLADSRKLRSMARHATTLDQLEWYFGEHAASGRLTFQVQLNVQVPIPRRAISQIKCTGEVSRVDLRPGGYDAWLFASTLDGDWRSALRLPLIQGVLADQLSAAPSEIAVGIINFEERESVSETFSDIEVKAAFRRFNRLIRRLGY